MEIEPETLKKYFEFFLKDEKLKEDYMVLFLDRFVYAATDLENGMSNEERKVAIEHLLEGFHYLLETDRKLAPLDIIEVANYVNVEAGIKGVRKINVSAGNLANWTPVAPQKIYYALYSLLDNYYNVWTYREVYEKEAAFHIALMRIHPFEDGNKRMAKLLMNANLMKQSYPPVVITEGETKQYYQFINDEDVLGFASFLRYKSLEEMRQLIGYYKLKNKIPITESIEDINVTRR